MKKSIRTYSRNEELVSRRRREMYMTAAKLFLKNGYQGTSMRTLAEAVGLSVAGLYHYIGTKDDIIHLIMEFTLDYEDKIIIPDEIDAVCRSFNIDPLISISEGTLVITATAEQTPPLLNELKQGNIDAWEIGEITEKDRIFIRKNGKREELTPVAVDPFWAAYFSTLEE